VSVLSYSKKKYEVYRKIKFKSRKKGRSCDRREAGVNEGT
jgi:hypothetical protein